MSSEIEMEIMALKAQMESAQTTAVHARDYVYQIRPMDVIGLFDEIIKKIDGSKIAIEKIEAMLTKQEDENNA